MTGEDEIKRLLREDVEVSKESLKILKGMRRSQRIATAFRILYWLIIIGGIIGVYYYLQPFIKGIITTLDQVMSTFSNIQKVDGSLKQGNLPPDVLKNIQDILKMPR